MQYLPSTGAWWGLSFGVAFLTLFSLFDFFLRVQQGDLIHCADAPHKILAVYFVLDARVIGVCRDLAYLDRLRKLFVAVKALLGKITEAFPYPIVHWMEDGLIIKEGDVFSRFLSFLESFKVLEFRSVS